MIFNRINMSVLDRIIITEKDVVKLKNTLDELMQDKELLEKVMQAEIPFDTKGIVSYEVSSPIFKNTKAQFYFNLAHSKGLEICEIDEKGNLLYRVILDTKDGDKHEVYPIQNYGRVTVNDMAEISKRVALMLLDFMKYTQYMGYLKRNSATVVKREVVNSKTQGNAKNNATSNDRTVVSVSKPKKVYDYEEAQREGDKRHYERHIESWEVVGHWRYYKKSDKRVFVKGYKKGQGKKKGKDYTL